MADTNTPPSEPKRVKRPKLTVKLVAERLQEKRGNLTAVARSVGWSRTQVRRFMEKHPELFEIMEEERESMTDSVVSEFYRTCIDPTADGHVTAMIFYLKTQAGWRESSVLDMNVNPQVHIFVPDNERDGETSPE